MFWFTVELGMVLQPYTFFLLRQQSKFNIDDKKAFHHQKHEAGPPFNFEMIIIKEIDMSGLIKNSTYKIENH